MRKTTKKLREEIKRIIGSNGCDRCDEMDGEYHLTTFKNNQQLMWNSKKKVFKCPRGHKENFYQAYRNSSIEDLTEKLFEIAKLI